MKALWRAVVGSRGLRISRIRRKKEKEEGGTRVLILITPCHTVQAQRAAYPRLRQQPATALKGLIYLLILEGQGLPKLRKVINHSAPLAMWRAVGAALDTPPAVLATVVQGVLRTLASRSPNFQMFPR